MSERQPLHTGTDDLIGWVEDGVAVLSFNRPSARNALSQPMYGGFATALPEIASRADIGCLVLTGEGGAFCAGGDVKGFAARNAGGEGMRPPREAAIDDLRARQREVSLAIHRFPKVTIAAIPGAAAGAGLSIALSCDLRVASEKAIITTAFAKIGASGDFGGSWFLTQLVGSAKARELYYLSDRVSAAEALSLGLTNWITAPEDLEAKTREIALRLATGPTVAYRYMKENLNRAMAGDVDDCLDLEATHHVHCGQTEDHRNATKAFVDKRAPVFVGR